MHKKQRSAKAEGEAVAAEQQQQPETESRKVSTNSGRDEQQNGSRRQHHASNGSLSLSRFAKEKNQHWINMQKIQQPINVGESRFRELFAVNSGTIIAQRTADWKRKQKEFTREFADFPDWLKNVIGKCWKRKT
jgi:hypothetical protein